VDSAGRQIRRPNFFFIPVIYLINRSTSKMATVIVCLLWYCFVFCVI